MKFEIVQLACKADREALGSALNKWRHRRDQFDWLLIWRREIWRCDVLGA